MMKYNILCLVLVSTIIIPRHNSNNIGEYLISTTNGILAIYGTAKIYIIKYHHSQVEKNVVKWSGCISKYFRK